MKSKCILIIILIVLISFMAVAACDRGDIHEATYEQIVSIKGLGDKLTTRLLSYLTLNPDCTLEDLDDVYGIGEERIKLLSKEWK